MPEALQHGEAEPLLPRGEDRGVRLGIAARQLVVVHVIEDDDVGSIRERLDLCIERRSIRRGDRRASGGSAVGTRARGRERTQEARIVLSRLPGADRQKAEWLAAVRLGRACVRVRGVSVASPASGQGTMAGLTQALAGQVPLQVRTPLSTKSAVPGRPIRKSASTSACRRACSANRTRASSPGSGRRRLPRIASPGFAPTSPHRSLAARRAQ